MATAVSESDQTPQLTIESVSVTDIQPHPRNPRVGNVAAIVASIKEHGQYKPILVQRSTGYVLAGNHTLLALRQLGRPTVEATYLDVDDDKAARILLVDNKASDDSGYDNKQLLELLESLDGELALIGTGFDASELELLQFDATSQAPIEMPRSVEKNGGKNTDVDSMVWGYLQFGTRRVVLTPVEVERLNALHDKLLEDESSDAGFGYHIADALDPAFGIDSEALAMERLNALNGAGKAKDNRGNVVGKAPKGKKAKEAAAAAAAAELADPTVAESVVDEAALSGAQGYQGGGDLEGTDITGDLSVGFSDDEDGVLEDLS